MIPPVVGEHQYALRIPRDLHQTIKEIAEREERSVNWVIVRLLRKATEQSDEWIREALSQPR